MHGVMKSDRRQIGARHIARARGAFRRAEVRPARKVLAMANPEPDGATQGACAPTPRTRLPVLPPLACPGIFRDLSGKAAAAGRNIAQVA